MRENTDQNNSEYGYFHALLVFALLIFMWINFVNFTVLGQVHENVPLRNLSYFSVCENKDMQKFFCHGFVFKENNTDF